MSMNNGRWVLSLPLLTLLGCATPYQAWDGVKGYQEEPVADDAFRITFAAEKFTGWERLDGYLHRRCQELLGSDVENVSVSDITHEFSYQVVEVETTAGAPMLRGADSEVFMPAPVGHHDTLFKLKQASGHCSLVKG